MLFESEAVTLIERARAATGYDARLNGLADGCWKAMGEARALDARTALAVRPLLFAVVAGPVPAWCAPACCQAAYVRSTVLQSRRALLQRWTTLDPDAAVDFSGEILDGLMVPASKGIAIAAAQMIAASPTAAVKHADRLVRLGKTHPKWQVKMALSRTLRIAVKAGARPAGLRGFARRLIADPNRQLSREGERLLRLIEPPDGGTHPDGAKPG